ncbi:MAG: MbnP family protein [Bacteroidia bacterium]
MLKKVLYMLFSIAALAAAMSFTTPVQTGLLIHFENYVGTRLLKLDSAAYKNELGQVYTVTRFKYYISNICLKKEDGGLFKLDESYLINEEEPASKEINLNEIPEGKYLSLSFIIGVDSLHNCSGAQAGALDPVNGMFWAWNSGYIFLKMEGKSPVSKSPGDLLEFHIGGYKSPYNCIRTIKLELGKGLIIEHGKTSSLVIKADLSELFKTPVKIDFSKLSSVTDFHNSTTIADNYAGMFSIKE